MALTYKIIEIRPYLTTWESVVDIYNGDRIYHQRFNTPKRPSDVELGKLIDGAIRRIEKMLEYEANEMNMPVDEEKAIECLRSMKHDIVLQVRKSPTANLTQTRDYINQKYPDSVISFDKLYEFYLSRLNIKTWDEFTQYCVNQKFESID